MISGTLIEPLEARIAPANLAFSITGGGGGDETITDAAVDGAGNIYVVGFFEKTVDFDPGPGVENRTATTDRADSFVAKYTSAGDLAWVDVIRASNESGNRNNSDFLRVAVTDAGDVFVSNSFGQQGGQPTVIGFFDGQSTLSTRTLTQISQPGDVYVTKYDTLGRNIWATAFGTSNPVSLDTLDLAVDQKGGIYLAGKMHAGGGSSSVDFGTFTLNADAGEDEPFFVKLQDGATPSVVWASDTSSPGVIANIHDLDIAVDRAGNVAVRGTIDGALTFATSPLTTISQSIFVAKLDLAGNWAWADGFDGGVDNSANVAFDSTGNVFVTGDFTGSIDIDPGPGVVALVSSGLSDSYLLKLDPAGAFVFAKKFGNFGENTVGKVGVDDLDRVHFEVNTGGELLDADPSPFVHLFAGDGVGVTLDNAGNYIEATAGYGSNSHGSDQSIVSHDGGFYRFGGFAGSFNVAFDSATETLKSKGGDDFFVARYFPGKLVAQDLQQPVLAQSFALGGAGEQFGGPVVVDSLGNLYVAGRFSGTVDFDRGPGVVNLTSSDATGNVFIAKYDPLGALQWAQQVRMAVTFAADAEEFAVKLALDAAGNVYIATEFNTSATLGTFTVTNPNLTPGVRDILIGKLGSNGSPIWVESIGNSGLNEYLIGALAVRASTGDVVLSGQFSGTVNFDPAGSPAGSRTAINNSGNGSDGYVLELDTFGAFKWVRQLGGSTAALTDVSGLGFLSGGDVVASGNFRGTIDFNYLSGSPALLTSATKAPNETSTFTARFTAGAGTVVWSEGFGGSTKSDRPTSIAVSGADEVFVAGQFTGSQDFDPGSGVSPLIEADGAPSEGDAFIEKLAGLDGSFLNAVGFGGTGGDRALQLGLDGTGSLFVLGKMGDSIDLDPGPGIARLTSKTDGGYFVSRFDPATLGFVTGFQVAAFSSDGDAPGNKGPGIDASAPGGFWVDAAGSIYLSTSFVDTLDLDPAGGLPALKSKGSHDIAVAKFAPANFFDAAHPRTFHDADGDIVTLRLLGPGTATYSLVGGAGDVANLAEVDLTGTTIKSAFAIDVLRFGSGNGRTIAQKILTTETEQALGTLQLAPRVTLGDGLADSSTDLQITGALKQLTLGDIAGNAIIRLGEDLPYDIADRKVPDTKNNFPTVNIGNVNGPGVELVALGKNAPLTGIDAGKGVVQGTGGGGFGNITVESWYYPGHIRTTQSIGNFLVQESNFAGILEIDKFHVGETTTANVGAITIADGSWGSSGTVIEGSVSSFEADAFLASASITAGSVKKITVGGQTSTDGFAGTLTLTEANAKGVATFTVTSDFTGKVISLSPLKKLNIRGTFTGSLSAPSIAGITAFSFLGTQTVPGVNDQNIVATDGLLGKIKALSGVFQNYELITRGAFSGIDVSLRKLATSTVGIENVHIQAASIGNLKVSLGADKHASGVNLVGIRNSTFTALSSAMIPLPGAVGTITVSLGGQDGVTLGLDHVAFSGRTIGATKVTVGRLANSGTDVRALDTATFNATTTLGKITLDGDATGAQATALVAVSGGTFGGLNIKSKTASFGSLMDGTILAGQALDFDVFQNGSSRVIAAALRGAALGAVTLSGSLTNSLLAAGSNIGAITVGTGDIVSSNLLAGTKLGTDQRFDGIDDSFQRASAIAAITVKNGRFLLSSAVAGIDPGANGFGDSDDHAAADGPRTASGKIGAIKLGRGLSGAFDPSIALTHVIESGKLKSLKVGNSSPVDFRLGPSLLDNGAAGQDSGDTLVRELAGV